MTTLKKSFFKTLIRTHRTLQRWLGASTVGVRILAINDKQEILLVKHTYIDGWHFPGGGVHHQEPLFAAAMREFEEETGYIATKRPDIFHTYVHNICGVTDYPVLFVLKHFKKKQNGKCSLEIETCQWFSLDAMPKDITTSTKQCLEEFFQQVPVRDAW